MHTNVLYATLSTALMLMTIVNAVFVREFLSKASYPSVFNLITCFSEDRRRCGRHTGRTDTPVCIFEGNIYQWCWIYPEWCGEYSFNFPPDPRDLSLVHHRLAWKSICNQWTLYVWFSANRDPSLNTMWTHLLIPHTYDYNSPLIYHHPLRSHNLRLITRVIYLSIITQKKCGIKWVELVKYV